MEIQSCQQNAAVLAITEPERQGILAMGDQILLRMEAQEIHTMLGYERQEVVDFLTMMRSLEPSSAFLPHMSYSLSFNCEQLFLLNAILRESFQELGRRDFTSKIGVPVDDWRAWQRLVWDAAHRTGSSQC